MTESKLSQFFRLKDGWDQNHSSYTFSELSLVANPPAISSETGRLAQRDEPELFARLVTLYEGYARAHRAYLGW